MKYAKTELHIINDVDFNDETFKNIDMFINDNKKKLRKQTIKFIFDIFFNIINHIYV